MNISLNDDDVAKIKINHLKKQPKKASIDRYTSICRRDKIKENETKRRWEIHHLPPPHHHSKQP